MVQLGALLTVDSATLAEQTTSTGNLTVSSGDALFATRTDLTIGSHGNGKLSVTGPATLRVGKDATIAEELDSKSTASLDGGGIWIVEGDLTVGSKGIAGVSVSNGAHLFALGSATLAEVAGSGATLTLSGRDTNGFPAMLSYAGDVVIGERGDAKLVLTNEAAVLISTNGSGIVTAAPHATATASVSIAGTNSLLEASLLKVAVGEGEPGGQATVTLLNGGQVNVLTEVETGDGGVIDVRGGMFTLGATTPAGAFGALQVNTGGLLAGCGRIKGRVINNGGEVAPGCSPGVMTVEGDYTQTAAGALTLGVTGGAGGASNDVLAVTGNMTLAGKLTLNFIDGFAPRQGQQFTLVQFGTNLVGSFDQVTITGLGPGFQYQLSPPTAGTLTLTAVNGGVAISPPVLAITPSPNQILISWPDTATGFILEANTNPTNLSGWQAFLGAITVTDGLQNVIVNTSNRWDFFRLRHP